MLRVKFWECPESDTAFMVASTAMEPLVIQGRESIKVHGIIKNDVWMSGRGQTILPDLT